MPDLGDTICLLRWLFSRPHNKCAAVTKLDIIRISKWLKLYDFFNFRLSFGVSMGSISWGFKSYFHFQWNWTNGSTLMNFTIFPYFFFSFARCHSCPEWIKYLWWLDCHLIRYNRNTTLLIVNLAKDISFFFIISFSIPVPLNFKWTRMTNKIPQTGRYMANISIKVRFVSKSGTRWGATFF